MSSLRWGSWTAPGKREEVSVRGKAEKEQPHMSLVRHAQGTAVCFEWLPCGVQSGPWQEGRLGLTEGNERPNQEDWMSSWRHLEATAGCQQDTTSYLHMMYTFTCNTISHLQRNNQYDVAKRDGRQGYCLQGVYNHAILVVKGLSVQYLPTCFCNFRGVYVCLFTLHLRPHRT